MLEQCPLFFHAPLLPRKLRLVLQRFAGIIIIHNFNPHIMENIHEFFQFARGKIFCGNDIIYLIIGQLSANSCLYL